ncbi:MAG: phosphatidylserine decarboxylase [Alphaproteobacteria bacterium]|nr:phosphatidylserine decarboxylase [Alphaproteobacteria bacterium]
MPAPAPVDPLRSFLPLPHRAGLPFIAIALAVTVVLFLLATEAGIAGAVIAAWVIYFFRDPERVPPARPNLVLAAADGKIVSVGAAVPPPELGLGPAGRMRVSIFLSVMDVHVNRSPVEGTVERIAYRPGRFFNAAFDKASEENERNAILMRLPDGRAVAVVQIAGLVARRILCDVREGQALRAGERFGMIRFGSRTDIYLPEGVEPLVLPGQTMIGGETVIADLGATIRAPVAVPPAAAPPAAAPPAAVPPAAAPPAAAPPAAVPPAAVPPAAAPPAAAPPAAAPPAMPASG